MRRLNNIAKILMLTVALLLLAGTRYAHAQSNTPGGPYINSWHQYSVERGSTSNTYQWRIFSSLADATSNPTGGTPLNGGVGQDWVVLSTPGTESRVAIHFVDAEFAPSTMYLVYAEYSGAICVARRVMELNIEANSFYEDLPFSGNGNGCNSFTDRVWDNVDDDLSLISDVTEVTFTVYMHKADVDFYIDNWQFDGTLTVTGANLHTSVFPANTGGSDQGSWTINDSPTLNDGEFHITVAIPENASFDTDYLTFTVNVMGVITEDFDIELTISNGIAESGSVSTFVSVTPDNGSGNKSVTRTIYGIPNTSLVTVAP